MSDKRPNGEIEVVYVHRREIERNFSNLPFAVGHFTAHSKTVFTCQD